MVTEYDADIGRSRCNTDFAAGAQTSGSESDREIFGQDPLAVLTNRRRRALSIAATVTGSVAAIATEIPYVESIGPNARAAGTPVVIDLARLAAGEMPTVEWRGKPV